MRTSTNQTPAKARRSNGLGLSDSQLAYIERKRNIERCADANWRSATKRNAMEDRVTKMHTTSMEKSLEISQRRIDDMKQKMDTSMRRILAHKTVIKHQRKTAADESPETHVTLIGSLRRNVTCAIQKAMEALSPENVRQKRINRMLEESRQRYRDVLRRSLEMKYSHKSNTF